MIVQGLYYVLYYSGQYVVFSNECVEGFRIEGKPFLLFMTSCLQLLMVALLVPMDLKKLGKQDDVFRIMNSYVVERMHKIDLQFGSYYWIKSILLEQETDWSKFKKTNLTWHRSTRKILGISLSKSSYEKSLDWGDEALKKIKRKYRRITFFMFIFPIINILINLIYIIQYSLPIDLPFPDAWLSFFESAVKFLERLWQYPLLAIVWCLFEIAIAITIYNRIFGLPSPRNFFKSILSKF